MIYSDIDRCFSILCLRIGCRMKTVHYFINESSSWGQRTVHLCNYTSNCFGNQGILQNFWHWTHKPRKTVQHLDLKLNVSTFEWGKKKFFFELELKSQFLSNSTNFYISYLVRTICVAKFGSLRNSVWHHTKHFHLMWQARTK